MQPSAGNNCQASCRRKAAWCFQLLHLPLLGMQLHSLSDTQQLAFHQGLAGHRCWANGHQISLKALRELGSALADHNGQHSSLRLR